MDATETRVHNRTSIPLLMAAGLSSGLLFLPSNTYSAFEGLVFGVFIACYFGYYEGHDNPYKIIAFIVLCGVSLPLAWFAGVGTMALQGGLDANSLDMPFSVLFVGGTVGAFMVLFATLLFAPPPRLGWSVSLLLGGSICGGILAVGGATIDKMLGHKTAINIHGVYMTWQTGVPLIMGTILAIERRNHKATVQ
jgi:hypothetical protein